MFVRKRAQKYGRDAIRAYYEAGHTVRQCQDCYGFSNGAWEGAVRRGDVVTRASPKPRGVMREAVARLYAEGLSQAAIALELGIPRPTVCFHLRMLGRNACWDAIRRGMIQSRPRLEPIEQWLIAGRRRNRYDVKSRLISEGLKQQCCEQCGLTD